MQFETVTLTRSQRSIRITFNRIAQKNSINSAFLSELNSAIDLAEQDQSCRVIILEGQPGVFCTGMDFEEIVRQEFQNTGEAPGILNSQAYLNTLKRFTLTPKVIISHVDGQVMAGGVGFVAASDLVVATPRSQFSLSEALWGLLPASVIPFLIRRVGFQTAYRMTLTTLPIDAQEAHAIRLVDDIDEAPAERIQRIMLRLVRLEESTIANLKRYFRKMWLITEQTEEIAISEFSKLIAQPNVRENIRNFVEYQRFPWENA